MVTFTKEDYRHFLNALLYYNYGGKSTERMIVKILKAYPDFKAIKDRHDKQEVEITGFRIKLLGE